MQSTRAPPYIPTAARYCFAKVNELLYGCLKMFTKNPKILASFLSSFFCYDKLETEHAWVLSQKLVAKTMVKSITFAQQCPTLVNNLNCL